MNWEEAKKSEVFSVLTGSRLYGTDRPDSDYDIRSVFIGSPLYTGPTTIRNPDGSDESTVEIREFVRLLTQGDNQKIEMLFAPSSYIYMLDQKHFQPILDIRKTFLSKAWGVKFLGFARKVIYIMQEQGGTCYTDLAHIWRVLACAFCTPYSPVVVDDFSINRSLLRQLKSGGLDASDMRLILKNYIIPLANSLTTTTFPEVDMKLVQTALGLVLTRFWGQNESEPSSTVGKPARKESGEGQGTNDLARGYDPE